MFDILWEAMADVMGGATTATLLRRAARRGAARAPELLSLAIVREGFEYAYQVPASWRELPDAGMANQPVCVLIHELLPLLIELTGPVVLRRLAAIPALHPCGLEPPAE